MWFPRTTNPSVRAGALLLRTRSLARCAASLAAAALHTLSHAQPDYNRDCVSNFTDSIEFMRDYSNLAPAADLNLDGVVNQADFDSFSESRAKTNFTVYWQATNASQAAPAVDRQTNLTGIPISRDAAIMYQQRFPKIPIRYGPNGVHLESGYQMMFRATNGTYSNWRANYDAWLALHIASLPALAIAEMPSPSFSGPACIDWEAIAPVRQQIIGDDASVNAWDQMVEQLNSPTFSPTFVAFAEWTPPAGTTGWPTLSAEQKTAFVNQAYRKVGLEFFIATLQGLRATRPNAKYCFYGQPVGAWLIYEDERKAVNDLLAPLWREVDILAPSTYPLFWTTNDPASSPCPDSVNAPGQNSAFFRSLIDECYRLKAAYPRPGQQIITYAAWHYKDQAGLCSPMVNPTLFVNDLNLLQQLQLPWWFGADGVAIWGHFGNANNPTYDTPAAVSAEMQSRWAEPIRRMVCPN